LSNCLGQQPNVWEFVSKDNSLTILASALKAAGLDEASQQPASFTVFAPNDEAFSKVPTEIAQHLSDPKNKNELIEALSYHAIGDRALKSTDLIGMNLPARLQTLTGKFITVTKQGDEIKINNATIIASDIMANNGIIHIIDAVLMAPSTGQH